MSNVSAQVIQSMFNHLSKSYSEDEAREILTQKYPDAETIVGQINPDNYRVTKVEMGSVIKVIEAQTEQQDDLKHAVKQKVAKVKPVATGTKKVSKADQAREMYQQSTDQSRAAMIALFMDKLGMSKAMASTYFYSCKG